VVFYFYFYFHLLMDTTSATAVAAACARLSELITPQFRKEDPDSCLLFIPRPKSIKTFKDDVIDAVLDAAAIAPETILSVGARNGGLLVLLSTPEVTRCHLQLSC
jgi:hypothetical protein